MKDLIKRFVQEEDGATMVEYGILVALIAAVVIVTVSTLGDNVDDAFTDVNTELEGAGTDTSGG